MHTFKHTRAHMHTNTRCSCYLMAWTTAASEIKSSFPVPVIHGHIQPPDDMCVTVCVWAVVPLSTHFHLHCDWCRTNPSAIPLQGFDKWGVCVCVSVSVCVMERIIWKLLLVSSILYHCGMLLSGQDLCYITHTYTYTRARATTYTNTDFSRDSCKDRFGF